MNTCLDCRTCESADKPLEAYIRSLPFETSHHRVESQKVKCGFGLQGACCRLCANGPCRITPNSPKGICGADGDTLVIRNFLRTVSAGSGCYIHVVENTARNLKDTALSKGVIKGEEALSRLCELFHIEGEDQYQRAYKVAEAVLDDLYKPDYMEMELTKKIAYPPRYARWKKLGILPGGAKSEIVRTLVKTSTNLNKRHWIYQSTLRFIVEMSMS